MQVFIGDSSKIFQNCASIVQTAEKDCKFYFDESCIKAFGLKEKLVSAPIIISLDWNIPFKVMCDASGVALGVVLGQRRNKSFNLSIMKVSP